MRTVLADAGSGAQVSANAGTRYFKNDPIVMAGSPQPA
jgi:hypothetical protein